MEMFLPRDKNCLLDTHIQQEQVDVNGYIYVCVCVYEYMTIKKEHV